MFSSRRTPAGEPTRILVVRNRYIGDTVLAIPFLRNLRRRFPEAVIDVLVEPGAGQVLADCPYKDELVDWQRPERVNEVVPGSLANIVATAPQLRRRRYDRAYILKRSLSTALLAWLAGIPYRVGAAADGRGLLLSRRVPLRKGLHEVELSLDLLRADGIEVDDGHNENWVDSESAATVDSLLAAVPPARPRVFVAPQPSSEEREWPLDRMATVIRWLIEDRGSEVFFCGSLRDQPTHRRLQAALEPRLARHLHDYTQMFSLRETSALLSRMDMCLGVDTGLSHVAASFGVPVVVLYGPTDPRQWHPWKTASAIVMPHGGGESMLGVTVAQVIDAAARLMHEAGIADRARRRGRDFIRTLDLRTGGFRYEIIESPRPSRADSPSSPEPAKAA